jgi:hypothetical protein
MMNPKPNPALKRNMRKSYLTQCAASAGDRLQIVRAQIQSLQLEERKLEEKFYKLAKSIRALEKQ